MRHPFRFFRFAYLALIMAGLAVVAVAASADCLLHSTRSRDAGPPMVLEPRGESAASMGDPALDGLFARYADLHRDAVGYAVADLVGSSMVAKGNSETRAPLSR